MNAIGYVKTTPNFKVELYALSGGQTYRISQMSGLNLNDGNFVPGTIQSMGITAFDSKVIQTSTRYTITFQPATSIPTSSQIKITFPDTITLPDTTSCSIVSGSNSGGISTSPTGCAVSSNILTLTNAFGTGSYSSSNGAIKFTLSTVGTNPVSATDAG